MRQMNCSMASLSVGFRSTTSAVPASVIREGNLFIDPLTTLHLGPHAHSVQGNIRDVLISVSRMPDLYPAGKVTLLDTDYMKRRMAAAGIATKAMDLPLSAFPNLAKSVIAALGPDATARSYLRRHWGTWPSRKALTWTKHRHCGWR
jgi:hypothetical protein